MTPKEVNERFRRSVIEYVEFTESLRKHGLIFVKKVTVKGQNSGNIVLPIRLAGRWFKVFLMPVDEEYANYSPKKREPIRESAKMKEKLVPLDPLPVEEIKEVGEVEVKEPTELESNRRKLL